MIGLIVTGHGHFATGLKEALEVIAGKQKCVEFIDFNINDSIDILTQNIENKIKMLQDLECEGIIFLTDIVGGSPFNTSVLLSQNVKKSRVISGTNLPMLLEVSLRRDQEDVEELKNIALLSGKVALKCFNDELKKKN